jgi:hypothetical protein
VLQAQCTLFHSLWWTLQHIRVNPTWKGFHGLLDKELTAS